MEDWLRFLTEQPFDRYARKYLFDRLKRLLIWLGHPALGALDVVFILHLNLYVGILVFLGYMWYQRQEFKEIQQIIKEGEIPTIGEIQDSCALDSKHFLYGFVTWAIIETVGRSL